MIALFECFSAEIWGNVSDWTMLIATGIIAFCIWRTLDKQKKILDEQRKLNANTSLLENEIDQLVYQLYDLTEDEIKIVEGDITNKII